MTDPFADELAKCSVLYTQNLVVEREALIAELATAQARLAEAEWFVAVLAALDQKHNRAQHASTPVFAINDAKVLHSDVRAASAFLATADSAEASPK